MGEFGELNMNDAVATLRSFQPDKDVTGEPLYTLMIIENGQNTGQFAGIPGHGNPIPLFQTRELAEFTAEIRRKTDPCVEARGLSKEHLRHFLFIALKRDWLLAIIVDNNPDGSLVGAQANTAELYSLYFPDELLPDGSPVPVSDCSTCGPDDE